MKKTIDIFCNIIDNYGDIGVVYRLAKELEKRGNEVRIFVNKLNDVSKIIHNFNPQLDYQKINNISFLNLENFNINQCAWVIIEAFGTDIPDSYINNLKESSKLIINLEYLTAESWAFDFHLKSSISPKPHMEKYFYMPGFHENSGGIILDENYLNLVEKMKNNKEIFFNKFYSYLNITYNPNVYYINIFTYNWDFDSFIKNLGKSSKKFIFFILDRRFQIPDNLPQNIQIYELDYIKQEDFDIYMNLSDFNFIRGEESIIRAILSEKPFIWNIYPQEEDYHFVKLQAFLDLYNDFEAFHGINMDFNKNLDFSEKFLNFIEKESEIFKCKKEYLLKNCDLVTKLLNFIDSKLKN